MASLALPISRRALFSPSSIAFCSLSTRQFHHRTQVRLPQHRRDQPTQPVYQPLRCYHSTLHPRPPTHAYTNSQTAILTAALPYLPTLGFSRAALAAGARDAGFLDVSVHLLPRGEFDLVLFWLASRRGLLRGQVEEGALLQRVAAERGLDAASLSVDDKVRILVMQRLRMNANIKHVWQDALAQLSLLGNIPLALSELHALANDIITLAGDPAVDASWYSRRLAVSAIYASAEVVMTRDPSADLAETETFVARRFEDKEVVKAKVQGVSEWIGFLGGTAVGAGRSWGLKI
ncbi:hypothetical protein N7462_007929 [Penicillium macrosclerotiorum]|uniref:uncharacterized protein n=1 Tax=Penicillium macrosclerotiorum TaxID=303699 RepID=UPI0025467458|nr:uncharacterized protein N7462_007929 [Penicillium macrosclerotiorum]KAJ5679685.1 hypothetical protein N7462_007929 [Penicillium macrosclerotiorum]